ncbi:MAG: hypothetical protein ABR508_01520 [Candidatus Baltobacteraceae bacterium]
MALCEQMRLAIAGCVLVNRWEGAAEAYAADVRRALQGKAEILGILPFDPDEAAAVEQAAQIFLSLL